MLCVAVAEFKCKSQKQCCLAGGLFSTDPVNVLFSLVVLIFYLILSLKAQFLLKAAANDHKKGERRRGEKKNVSNLMTVEKSRASQMAKLSVSSV